MTGGRKKRGPPAKPFLPGNQHAKGKGRPPSPPELRAARSLTRTELEATLNRYLYMTTEELLAAWGAPSTTMLDRMVITVIKTAIEDGDATRLSFLLDRVVGRPKDAVDPLEGMDLRRLSRAQVIAIGEEALAFLRGEKKEPST